MKFSETILAYDLMLLLSKVLAIFMLLTYPISCMVENKDEINRMMKVFWKCDFEWRKYVNKGWIENDYDSQQKKKRSKTQS